MMRSFDHSPETRTAFQTPCTRGRVVLGSHDTRVPPGRIPRPANANRLITWRPQTGMLSNIGPPAPGPPHVLAPSFSFRRARTLFTAYVLTLMKIRIRDTSSVPHIDLQHSFVPACTKHYCNGT
eukprot:3933027-Rhodomonas_salina.2